MRTKAVKNMVKIKLLLLLCILFAFNACSLTGKKDKNNESSDEITSESKDIIEEANSNNEDPPTDEDENISDVDESNQEDLSKSAEDEEPSSSIEDIEDLFADNSENNLLINKISEDELGVYSDVIRDMQDEITMLRSQLDMATEEIYKLKAKSQIWENPFSIYNKEIILTNGSTVYGNITYQDQDILFVETLIAHHQS